MNESRRATLAIILPFALWMAMMLLLPSSPIAYAVRTTLCLAAIGFSVKVLKPPKPNFVSSLVYGILIGFLVLFIWVWPERFEWYRHYFILGEGGTAKIDTSATYLKAIRLFGSAFVIAPAEEMFFRSFLYRWVQNHDWRSVSLKHFDLNAFCWMIGLFALEHDRFLVGAIAGALYGLLAIKKGLAAAIVAHIVTNLALGIYVLMSGNWAFW